MGLKKDLTPARQALVRALSAPDPKKAREGLAFAKLTVAAALANHQKISVASSNKLFKKLMKLNVVENMVKIDNGWLFDDKNLNQKAEIAKVIAHIRPMHQDLLKAIREFKKP